MHSPYIKISTEGTAQSEKLSQEATLPRAEKSMHKYLGICIIACSTERIPGSIWSLWPTEFINQEKGKSASPAGQRTSWSDSQGSWPGQETRCLPLLYQNLLSCPFIFSWRFWLKRGKKDVFVRNFLGFPSLYGETQRCFGQVSYFVSLFWHTIESHSGGRKRLLMVSLAKDRFHWKWLLENSLVFHWP